MSEPGFLNLSDHNPDNKAFFDADTGEWFTRAQLSSRVTAFAKTLPFPKKALGFHFSFNDSGSLIAYLAAIQAGHAVALLDPEMDSGFKSALIARFQPDFIVSPASHPPEIPSVDSSRYSLSDNPCAGQLLLRARDPHRYLVHPELTILNSTSGSTGSSKLVRLSWQNLESNAGQITQALLTTERDCTMVTAPVFNGLALSVIHTHLLEGASFVLTRQRIMSRSFWDSARKADCNSIVGTPIFYQTLDRMDLDSLGVPGIKKFVQTGGRLPEDLARRFHALAVKRSGALHLMYGLTEATARIAGLPPELVPTQPRSVGFVLAGGRISTELDRSECPPMQEGELIYEGPNVMMGYAMEPADLEKGYMLDGRLETGDLGYLDERGLVFITGRKARFVKLHGWRISLDDIEEILSHTGTVAAVNENDRIVVYGERNNLTLGDSAGQLPARLRIHPSGFEVRIVEKIPHLTSGKIDYRSLTLSVSQPYTEAA